MQSTMQTSANYVPLLISFALHASLILPIMMKSDVLKNPFGATAEYKKAQVKFVQVPVKMNPVKRTLTVSSGRTTVTTKAEPNNEMKSVEKTNATPSSKTSVATNLGVAGGTVHATVKEHYVFGLRHLLEQKKIYPAMSRRMGEAGNVVVALQITRDGLIEKVEIKSSSKFSRLDEAALATVSGVKKYQPIPDEIQGEKISIIVPIEYSLQ